MDLNEENFKSEVLESKIPVLVDFGLHGASLAE